MALTQLQLHNWIYRDLHTGNLLLDSNGYLKLTDFGNAKHLGDDREKTGTVCGCKEYMAPEMLRSDKPRYGKAVDWWALGILIYEMLVGAPPFTDDHDPMMIYQKVLKGVVPEPKGQRPLAKEAKSIIDRLLVREPTERLGCMKLGTDRRFREWARPLDPRSEAGAAYVARLKVRRASPRPRPILTEPARSVPSTIAWTNAHRLRPRDHPRRRAA